jgi:hypothetical protein
LKKARPFSSLVILMRVKLHTKNQISKSKTVLISNCLSKSLKYTWLQNWKVSHGRRYCNWNLREKAHRLPLIRGLWGRQNYFKPDGDIQCWRPQGPLIALQRKSHLCIPFLGIAWPQPQFQYSWVYMTIGQKQLHKVNSPSPPILLKIMGWGWIYLRRTIGQKQLCNGLTTVRVQLPYIYL